MSINDIGDLFIEYGRVNKLCAGTIVKPENCVLWNNEPCSMNFLNGNIAGLDGYKFALAIIEDKPVFYGDTLYNRFGETVKIVTIFNPKLFAENYSWNPPKPDPYADFKIDDKVLVWNEGEDDNKIRRYFAGINQHNEATVFEDGATSFSSSSATSYWDHCIKYEE